MMNHKPFHLGILVGRFQTMHSGHEMMVQTAVDLCEKVAVFIGSSQESGTNKNPLTYEFRKELLENVFGGRISIYPLPDIGVGNNSKWGDYVLENVLHQCGQYPDLLVSGKESRRVDWFDSINGLRIAELYIPKTIDMSASRMREMLVNDDYETWKQYVNEKNLHMYPQLRAMVLASKDHLETQSI